MNIHHDSAPLLPNGNHPNYRPYDAVEGKERSLYGTKSCCPICERYFPSARALEIHCRTRHTGEGA